MSANSSAVEEGNKNPLANTSSTQESNERIVNKRGRPKSENSIRFGPQPKSLVAQMLIQLKKKKTESPEVTVISDDEESKTIEASIDSQDEACVPNSDFICKLCSHSSTSQEEYDKHHSTHKTFVCYYPNCSYTCKLSCNLIKHKRIHTDEKPYVCDECAFRTNFINSLKAHKRIHTSERPHKCQWCDYQCNSSSNLKKHCRHRHNGAP